MIISPFMMGQLGLQNLGNSYGVTAPKGRGEIWTSYSTVKVNWIILKETINFIEGLWFISSYFNLALEKFSLH